MSEAQESWDNSRKTYETLKANLWKAFVDDFLIKIIWFEKTLETASTTKGQEIVRENISQEVSNILSDTDSAMRFARKVISYENKKRFENYFGKYLKDESKIEDVLRLMESMIDGMNLSLYLESIEETYFDYVFLFSFDGRLKSQCPHIFGQPNSMGTYTFLPQQRFEEYIRHTDFKGKFLQFLKNFYQKIDTADHQDQMKMYFFSEFLIIQSGKREWIWNTMNPMIQDMTLSDMFWDNRSSNKRSIFKKLHFRVRRNIPGTDEYIRAQMNQVLGKMIDNYMFPKLYRNSNFL